MSLCTNGILCFLSRRTSSTQGKKASENITSVQKKRFPRGCERGGIMPAVVIPLALNVLILAAAWMSQLATAIRVLITAVVVIKFSLYVYSVLVCDTQWLRKSSYIAIPVMNIVLLCLGVSYNVLSLSVLPAVLTAGFVIWIILPHTAVSQKKEGSSQ